MKKILSKNDIIFIAGGNGLVGSAIKRIFKKQGYKNILAPSRNELDLFNQDAVRNWFNKNKPHIVIIAAAKVGGIYANSIYPADFLVENLKIQSNIIETAWKNNVKKLVFLGSSCIYPKFAEQPIKEESLLNGFLEKTNEYYAIAKIAGLKLCESLRIQHRFDAISLMPTNLYGPNDNYHEENSHVIASLIRKFLIAKATNASSVVCWGSGSVFREFLHVDDLAEALIFCLCKWDPSQISAPKDISGNLLNHLNVGTGKDISIKNLAELIAKIVDFKGEILWDLTKPDGTPKKLLDVSRINKLGWESRIDLETGLKQTIEEIDINQLDFY